MLTEQRHEIILNLLSEKGSITVTELKDILNTSESTIRRDLNTLDEQGRLTKVFGGAVEKINGVSTTELSVSQKADVNTEEKKKIAMYAARLVVPNDFIYIDAGTTTEYLIDYLEEKTATYVTNAVTHARKLAIAGFKVILIGGELKGITEAVVGNQAIITIDRMNFNKGFFGFEILIGIGIRKRPQGITCFNPDAGIIFVIDRRIGALCFGNKTASCNCKEYCYGGGNDKNEDMTFPFPLSSDFIQSDSFFKHFPPSRHIRTHVLYAFYYIEHRFDCQ